LNNEKQFTSLLWLICRLLGRALGVLGVGFGLWRGGGRPARAAARGGGGFGRCGGAAPLAPGDGVWRRRRLFCRRPLATLRVVLCWVRGGGGGGCPA
jgi:hypothetical protein